VRGFLIFTVIHVLNTAISVVKMLFVLLIFFSPLQVKINLRDGGTKHAFILGPNSLVVNN
jgi:hypothetical protein